MRDQSLEHATRYPHAFAELSPGYVSRYNPYVHTPTSNLVATWTCTYAGHPYKMSFAERVRKGCPQCLRLRSVAKRGSLADKRPDLAEQWVVKDDERTPADYSPGSRYEATWRCIDEGHEFTMRVERRVAGCDCPYCANRLLLRGFNDFATRHPALAADWSPKNLINPEEIFPNSNRKWNWKCKHGHERYTSTAHRILSGGCPECPQESRAATRRPPEPTDQM